jgi:hypothetical protein
MERGFGMNPKWFALRQEVNSRGVGYSAFENEISVAEPHSFIGRKPNQEERSRKKSSRFRHFSLFERRVIVSSL